MNEPWTISVAAITHMGCVRSNNEDCIAIGGWLQGEPMEAPQIWEQQLEDSAVVCMVFDGMGGHADGEVAARLSAEYLARELPPCADELSVGRCIERANQNLFESMYANPAQLGMGTTLAGVRVSQDAVLVFNVGDSRVYRAQEGCMVQLSIDDVQRERGNSRRTNLITQSLGGAPYPTDIEPHVSRMKIGVPGTYLLCSDGLYDALDVDTIETTLEEQDDLASAAALLIERALAARARDNVSVILIRLSR